MLELKKLYWKKLERAELLALYHAEMKRDFPPDELRSPQKLLALYDNGCYCPYGVFCPIDSTPPQYGNTPLVAYLHVIYPTGADIALLDYFATTPSLRGTGLGEALLKELCTQETARGTRALLWESETPDFAPDKALATRRMAFYQRSGGKPANLRCQIYDTWYDILYCPCAGDLSQQAAQTALLGLYQQLIPGDLFAEKYHLECLMPPPKEPPVVAK